MSVVPELLASSANPVQGERKGPPAPTAGDIEREVLENVKHQPLAAGTVDDLALPEDFLRRVADRAVRASYEERYRIVVPDGKRTEPGPAPAGPTSLAIPLGGLVLAGIVWLLIARRGASSRR